MTVASLHIANQQASHKVCAWHNDWGSVGFYNANMARSRPRLQVGWFITEWMDALDVNQAAMIERAGWSKTTASLVYNHQQDFNPALVKAAAQALNIAPFELFLHPEEAFHIRRLRAAVEEEGRLRMVTHYRLDIHPAEADEAAPKTSRQTG